MQTGIEHITTTTLTAFEWALIVGLCALAVGALGFFLSRLVKTLDRLDSAVVDLKTTLAGEYVTKDDLARLDSRVERFERRMELRFMGLMRGRRGEDMDLDLMEEERT